MRWTSQHWPPRGWSHLLTGLCCFVVLGVTAAALGDPYKLLGVGRSATLQEIRRAYRQLAKEWHPDKTKDPSAESRFVEIKLAYELLCDPERRKIYDLYGITDDDSARLKRDSPSHGRFSVDPFEEFFGGQDGRFRFQDQDITFFHRMSITSRQYDNSVVIKSHQVPHIVFFYTDWCFTCIQAAPTWRKLVDALEPLGVTLVTMHAGREPGLARRLSIHSLPCIVLVIEGKTYVYKDSIFNVPKVVEFLRNKLPYKLVPVVTDSSLEDFLNGWTDNRVHGLIFEPRLSLRLRYLITAFQFRERIAFGFVKSDAFDSVTIKKRYKVPSNMDTVLLFNENVSYPIASISMKDIPTQTLHHVISSNQFLTLPRLSSQKLLEALCPSEWNRPRKHLCVVLITQNSDEHDPHRQSLRRFAQESAYNVEKVRFAYLYLDKQKEFVNALTAEGKLEEPLLRIVIIWRRDTHNVKYEWLPEPWQPDGAINSTRQKLEETVSRLLRTSEALTHGAVVKDLLDEHAQGIVSKIFTKMVVAVDILYESATRDQLLPILSVFATIVFIVGIGYFMAYLVRLEEESVKQRNANAGNNNNDPSSPATKRELQLHELRAEKYNGLVRLLKPGCRTVVLLVDSQSKFQLIPVFHRTVWPYRKNKTLMFAYMSLERGLAWYRELLQLSLPEPKELNINPRNCVGTVLSLNGHRKYFCMYHAKHPETSTGNKRMVNMTRRLDRDRDPEAGAFIGFESDTSESEEDAVLLQGSLLDGLANWLDRLFEGTTHRYYVNYWPDFPTK